MQSIIKKKKKVKITRQSWNLPKIMIMAREDKDTPLAQAT